jgi:hypothetical protein
MATKKSSAKKIPAKKSSAKKAAPRKEGIKNAATKKAASKKTTTKAAAKKSPNKSSARKYSPGSQKNVETEMKAMKKGKLNIGRSTKKVTDPKQAIAIGLSKARKEGKKVPPPPK